MTELRIKLVWEKSGNGGMTVERMYRDDANDNERAILDIIYSQAKLWLATLTENINNAEGCSAQMSIFGENKGGSND